MDGGKMTIRAALWVGYNGGTGTFNMSNGTLTVNNSLVPAYKGTGRFFQGGGTVNANNYLTIGHNVGDGAYTIHRRHALRHESECACHRRSDIRKQRTA